MQLALVSYNGKTKIRDKLKEKWCNQECNTEDLKGEIEIGLNRCKPKFWLM